MSDLRLPEGWVEVNLKDYVTALETGKRPKGGAVTNGIPSLGGEHINSRGTFNIEVDKLKYVPKEFYEKMKSGIIKQGDILIVKDGATTGKVAYVSNSFPLKEACINEHVFLLRINSNIDSKLLSYYFRSEIGQKNILNDFRGATVGGISKEFVNFEFLLPPLETQKKIVHVLEKAEKALEKRKEAYKLLDELVKSRFIEMFGDPVSNPMRWKTKILSDISTSRLGKMLDSKKQTGKNLYPYLANFNVQWFRFELKRLNEMDFDEKEQKEFELRKGDLLVCEGGEVGRSAVWEEEISDCYFQKALHRVRCNQEMINPYYLAWLFYYRAKATGFKEVIGSQATIAHLTGEKLKQLEIVVPPIAHQNEFADFNKQVDKLKFEMEKSLKGLENNFSSLMQAAFNGNIRFN
jgi:type I restriction enzyme S subunit